MTIKRKTLGKLVAVVSKGLKSAVGGSDEVILLTLPEDVTFKEVDEGELYDLMLCAPKITHITFHHYPHKGNNEALEIKITKG